MWTKITSKDQSQPEKVYDGDKDLPHSLHQIVADMKEKANQEMYNDWSISYKDLKTCDIKTTGTGKIALEVNQFFGGLFQVGKEDVKEMVERGKDTKKLLDKFESALKKEFKKRTGKTLKMTNVETFVNWELVSSNHLYRFFAIRTADLKTELDGQSYSDE